MANDITPPTPLVEEPTDQIEQLETGIDKQGMLDPTVRQQVYQKPVLQDAYVDRARREDDQQVYGGQDSLAVPPPTPTEILQDNIDSVRTKRIQEESLPKVNREADVHMKSEEKRNLVKNGIGDLNDWDKAVLNISDSPEEAALIAGNENQDFYKDSTEANKILEANRIQKKRQEEEAAFKFLTPEEVKRAKERGVTVADLASMQNLNESEDMWYRAKAEVYDKQMDFLRTEINRSEVLDFYGNNYWEATGVEDVDHLIGSARSGVNRYVGVGGYVELLDEQIALKTSEGQISPRALDAQRTVAGIELEKEKQFQAYTKFLDLAKEYNLSDEQIRQRSHFFEKNIASLDQQLGLAVETYKDVPSLMQRFNIVNTNITKGSTDMVKAYEEFGDKNILKGSWDATTNTVSYALDIMSIPFQYGAVLYHSMQGTTNYEMFQNVEKYSNEIAELTAQNAIVGRSYQNERILRQGEADLANLINENKQWLFDIDKAFNEGTTDQVGQALASLTLGSIGDFMQFAIRNPIYAAGETTKVATELMLPGTTVKFAGALGKGVHGLKVNRDFNKIAKHEDKKLQRTRKDILNDFKKEKDELRAKYNIPKDTPDPAATALNIARTDRQQKLNRAYLAELQSAKANVKHRLSKAQKERDDKLAIWDNVKGAGNKVQTGTLMFQAAQEGLNIYNSSLQDYMHKTGGKLPTLEERNQMMAYASLGGFVDFLSDRFIVGTSGILSSFAKSPRPKGGGLTLAEKDQFAKGITNRVLRSTSAPIRSTLAKSKRMVPPKVRKKVVNPALQVGKAGVGLTTAQVTEGLTEGLQTDLEMNLANYVLGTDREADSIFDAYIAGAIGFIAGGGMRAPRTAIQVTPPLVGVVKDTVIDPTIKGFSVARTLTVPAAQARLLAPVNKVGRLGALVKQSASDIGTSISTAASTAKQIIETKPKSDSAVSKLGVSIAGKVVDSYDSAKYVLSLMGVGTPKGTIFYNLNNPVEAIKNLNFKDINVLNAAALEGKNFINQTKKIIVAAKDVELTTKALENLNTVKVHIMDTLANANPKEKVALLKNLQGIVKLQEELRNSQGKKGKETIEKLKNFYKEQKASGIAVKNIKASADTIAAVTRYFRSGIDDGDLDNETFEILTEISINSNNPELQDAIHRRVAQARIEGAFRNEFSEGKQVENLTPESVRSSMLVGSRLFVGVDEYIKEVSRILNNLFKNAKGDANLLRQNRFVWVSNFNAVTNFIRDHLVKHDILDLAIKEFETLGELSEDAESALKSVNIKWLGLDEAKNLLNQIKKDLVKLSNRQTFLINKINEALGSVLSEDEKPVGIEIPVEKLNQVEVKASTAVAIEEEEEVTPSTQEPEAPSVEGIQYARVRIPLYNDKGEIVDYEIQQGKVQTQVSKDGTKTRTYIVSDIGNADRRQVNLTLNGELANSEFEIEYSDTPFDKPQSSEGVSEETNFELQPNETVLDTVVDKKGRVVTYVAIESTKDGITTYKIKFNRGDKESTQRSIVLNFPLAKALSKLGLNYETDSEEVEELTEGDLELGGVKEIRIETGGNRGSADVVLKGEAGSADVALTLKPKPTEPTKPTSQAAGRQQQLETQPTEEVPAGIEATQEISPYTEIPPEFIEFGMDNVPEEIQEYFDESIDDVLWNQMNAELKQELMEMQEEQKAAEQQELVKPLEEVLSEALDRRTQGKQSQEDEEIIFQDLLRNPKKLAEFLKPYKKALRFNADWDNPTSLRKYNKGKTPKSLQQYIYEKGGIWDEGSEFTNFPRLRRLNRGTIKSTGIRNKSAVGATPNSPDYWVEHLKQTGYWREDIEEKAIHDLHALQLHLERTYGIGDFQDFADNGGLHTIYETDFVESALYNFLNDSGFYEDLAETLDYSDELKVPDAILARAIYFNIPIRDAAKQLGRLTPDQQEEQNILDLKRKEADKKQARQQRQGAFDFTPSLGQAGQDKVRKTLPSRFEEDSESISVVNQFVEFYKGKKGLLSQLGLEVLYSLEVISEDEISKGKGLQQFASTSEEVFVLNLIQRIYNQTYNNFSGDMTPVIKRVLGENIATLDAQPLKGANLNFSRYFLDDSKHMPREFSIAITLGIVDHLLNFDPQRASLRTSEDIAKMFRLDFDTEKGGKGERVPLNIEQRYKSLGVLKTTMLTELGKNVWKYLEMREIRQDDFKANFENYFGNLALDALEQIGVLEKDTTSVTMQQFAQDKAEIINHNKSRDQSPQEADEDIKGYQTFYKLKTVKPDGKVYNAEVANREAGTSQLAKIYGYIPINQFEVQEFIASMEAKKIEEFKNFPSKRKEIATKYNSIIKQFRDKLKEIETAELKGTNITNSKFLFQSMFYSKDEQGLPTLKPKNQKFDKGLTNIPKQNIENQKIHNSAEHNLNEYLVAVLQQLYINPANIQAKTMLKNWFGYKDISTMRFAIEADIEAQQGLNTTIEGDLNKLVGFMSWLKQNDVPWKDTAFYLSNTFQPSLRLQTTGSAIDTLGSKIHRAFLQLSGNPNISTDLTGRTKTDKALSFFYINALLQKSGVQKDLTDESEVFTLWEKLQNGTAKKDLPALTDAVIAFEKVTANSFTDPDMFGVLSREINIVQTFLDEADSPSAGLEVLSSELARQQAMQKKKKKFKTYMNTARDGISSGLFLGVHYLNGAGKNHEQGVADVLKMMGGFSQTTTEQSLAEIADANKPDGYEIVAYYFLKYMRNLESWAIENKDQVGLDKDAGHNVFKTRQSKMAKAMNWIFTHPAAFGFDLSVLDDFDDPTNSDQRTKIRKLMKHDVIAKIFGQGTQGSARGIRNWMIKGIHKIASDLNKRKVIAEENNDTAEIEAIKMEINELNLNINNLISYTPSIQSATKYITYDNLANTNLRKNGSFYRDSEASPNFFTPQTIFDEANKAVLFNFADYRDIINNTVAGQIEIFKTLFNARLRLRQEQFSNRVNKEVNGKTITKFDPILMGIPKEEVEAELNRLANVVFRFRTPLADKDPNKREGIQFFELKLVRDKSEFTRKSSGVNLGRPSYQVIYKPTGITIGMIHSTEAGIASIGTTVNPVVSTHDSQTTILEFTDDHTEAINQITYMMLQNFSIWGEFVEGMQRTAQPTTNAINHAIKHNLLTQDEIRDLALNMYRATRPKNANTFNRLYEDPTQLGNEVKKIVRSFFTPEEIERAFQTQRKNGLSTILAAPSQYKTLEAAISNFNNLANGLPSEQANALKQWLNELSKYNTWRKENITAEKLPEMQQRYSNYLMQDLGKIASPTFTGKYTGIYHYANLGKGHKVGNPKQRKYVKQRSKEQAPSNMVAVNGWAMDEGTTTFEYAQDNQTTGSAQFGSSTYTDTDVFDGTDIASTRMNTPLTSDNLETLLIALQNTGDRQESANNMAHLRRLMNLLSNRIQDIRVVMHQSGQVPAVGVTKITESGTDIYLNAVNNTFFNSGYNLTMHDGVPMSGAEVLAHEVLHALGHNLIDTDSQTMREIRKLWNVAKDLVKPEDLIPQGLPHDAVNLAAAQNTWNKMFAPQTTRTEQVSPILNSRYGQRKYSDHLHEFISIVATNEQARKALTNLDYGEIKQAEIDAETNALTRLKEQLTFWVKKYVNQILSALDNRRFNPYQSNLNTQFDNLFTDLFAIEARQNTVLFNAKNRVGESIQTAVDYLKVPVLYGTNEFKQNSFVDSMTNFIGTKYREGFEAILGKDLTDLDLSKELETVIEQMIIETDFYGIEQILAEVQGTTERNRFASDLIRLRNQFEAKERQEIMRAVHRLTKAPFTDERGKVDPEVAKNIFDVLIKTDIAALLKSDINTLRSRDEFNDYLKNLLSSTENIYDEIDVLHAKLDNLLSDKPEYAMALKHGAQNIGFSLLHHTNMNAVRTDSIAAVIRNLADKNNGLGVDLNFDIDQVNFVLNQLATLEALSGVPEDQRLKMWSLTAVHSARDIQQDGIHNIVSINRQIQELAKKNSAIFNTDLYFRKGYFKEVSANPDIVFQIAPPEAAPELYARLYESTSENIVRDSIVDRTMPNADLPDGTQRIFRTYYSSQTTEFQEASFSIAAPTKGRGASIVSTVNPDPQNLGDMTTSTARGINLANMNHDRKTELVRLSQTPIGRMPNKAVVDRNPVPANIFVKEKADGTAEVFDYRQRLNWEQKLKVSQVKQDPFETLAHTVGNHVSKTRGRMVNQKVVEELLIDYNQNVGTLGQDAYVFISHHTGDKKLQEKWAMLPEATRHYIQTVSPHQEYDNMGIPVRGIYVRKDLLNSIFGYRKISVRNLIDWLHENPEDNKQFKELLRNAINTQLGQLGFKALVGLEDIMADLTNIVKDSVVVKSILVNVVNVISNTIQLMIRGLSLKDAIALQLEASIEATKYSRDAVLRRDLLLKLNTVDKNSNLYKKLKTQLAELEDNMARNRTAFLMEAGAMQTIVEDLEAVTLDRNLNRKPLTRLGNAALDASPKWINSFFSQFVMAEDTLFYTWANNAVKLSDFSARYAYVKHLEKHTDLDQDKRIRKAMDEFVDYDIPTSQWIQYGNDIGMLWFTKYGLRTMGVAASLLVNHPGRVATLFMGEHLFGEVSTVLDLNPGGRIGNVFDRADAVEKIAPWAFLESTLGV